MVLQTDCCLVLQLVLQRVLKLVLQTDCCSVKLWAQVKVLELECWTELPTALVWAQVRVMESVHPYRLDHCRPRTLKWRGREMLCPHWAL